ncbi:hypothetical protein GGI23_007747, partial [Coemansia sp. RSA 2559]
MPAKSSAFPVTKRPTMSPKSPMTLPKISITRILTNSCWSCASATAAFPPVMPTASPQIRFASPTASPPQNSENP